MTATVVPHDTDAEECLLGAMMLSADAATAGVEMVDGADFYSPKNGAIFSAIAALHRRGVRADAVSVEDEMRSRGAGDFADDSLVTYQVSAPSTANASHYAAIVVKHAAARRLQSIAREALEATANFSDPYELADKLTSEIAAIDTPLTSMAQQSRTIEDIVASAEDQSPWVIPGMMRVDWRAVIVAKEGSGKSVLLRSIAMMAAQGLHPLRRCEMPAIRSLIVDLENPMAAIAETGQRIAERLRFDRDDYDPDRCRVYMRPGGLDLRTRHDRTALEHEIQLHRPDLVCIGPAYKMLYRREQGRGSESHEESTDPVLRILDDLRTRHNFALIIEHHAPQGYGGGREMRPYGSQRWMAWPELGIGLVRDQTAPFQFDLVPFRGDRLEADWPTSIARGSVYPWDGIWRKKPKDEAF